LVFLVVSLFLQNFRATLIPAVAIPVSLVGTFLFMLIFGFSVNILTMFALVLSIGIVVDDAIVVVEAVHHRLRHGTMHPKEATRSVMRDITPAIMSITMVMVAVFVPVGFVDGPVGMFYREFSYTLVFAILISAVNALTLSPVLCAFLLKRDDESDKNTSA